jgi:hypothetical protein
MPTIEGAEPPAKLRTTASSACAAVAKMPAPATKTQVQQNRRNIFASVYPEPIVAPDRLIRDAVNAARQLVVSNLDPVQFYHLTVIVRILQLAVQIHDKE